SSRRCGTPSRGPPAPPTWSAWGAASRGGALRCGISPLLHNHRQLERLGKTGQRSPHLPVRRALTGGPGPALSGGGSRTRSYRADSTSYHAATKSFHASSSPPLRSRSASRLPCVQLAGPLLEG